MAGIGAAGVILVVALLLFQRPARTIMDILLIHKDMAPPGPITIVIELPGCAKGTIAAFGASKSGFYMGGGTPPDTKLCAGSGVSGLRKIPAGDFGTNLCLGVSGTNCQTSTGNGDLDAQATELLAMSESLNRMITKGTYALPSGTGAQNIQTTKILVQLPAGTGLSTGSTVICPAGSGCGKDIPTTITLCLQGNNCSANLPNNYAYASSLLALWQAEQIQ